MSHGRLTRRGFLARTAALGAASAASGANARTIHGEVPWAPGQADAPIPVSQSGSYVYFTPEEAAFIESAVARLIPADELGPGARELGCPLFLDRQLAGAYGRAQRWYMQGPWAKGSKTQGYQSRMTPAQMYRAAIKAIDAYCGNNFDKKSFAQLGPDDQDKVLSGLEGGQIKLDEVEATAFFKQLLLNTREGYFSDPLYGGNKNMAAWKMIGFPGARYDYRDYVAKHGERFPLPPVSLRGRPAWNDKS
jgi:gluconate 2-dehydrogenase gamma chain